MANRGVSSINTTGVTGVYRMPKDRWRARIVVDGKNLSLGCFPSFEEAVAARKAAEAKYHGEYARAS
jgi:hypothetical protein